MFSKQTYQKKFKRENYTLVKKKFHRTHVK